MPEPLHDLEHAERSRRRWGIAAIVLLSLGVLGQAVVLALRAFGYH